MKLFLIFIGFITLSTALPQEPIRRGHEVPPSESQLDKEVQRHDVAIVGQSVEARQFEPGINFVPPVVALGVIGVVLVGILGGVVTFLVTEHEDNNKRKKYTKNSVQQAIAKFPQYSWVITHSTYTNQFQGVQGTDWGHIHHELPISFGRTIGYDVFCVKTGTFTLTGDGGYQNWAWDGYTSGTEGGGSIVHFVAHS